MNRYRTKRSHHCHGPRFLNMQGFTLIEVLIALAIIAISLTAVLKSNAANIANSERLYDKTISHWVAIQAMRMIELRLIPINPSEEPTKVTTFLGEKWYWRVLVNEPNEKLQRWTILISKKETGPYEEALMFFRAPPDERSQQP